MLMMVVMISFKSWFVTNLFPQSKHRKGLSPVCLFIWAFRLLPSLNVAPHSPHECGHPSKWDLTRILNWSFNVKLLPHVPQMKVFSPECISRCWPKSDLQWNIFPQASHMHTCWCTSLSCMCTCFHMPTFKIFKPYSSCIELNWIYLHSMNPKQVISWT